MSVESEIKMKLGDIIKIESTNPDYNSYFFVEYIDDEIIKIVNVENGKKETVDLDQDGCLTEHHSADSFTFAKRRRWVCKTKWAVAGNLRQIGVRARY